MFYCKPYSQEYDKKAHQKAASNKEGICEFAATGLNEEYLDKFHAPYVGESTIKQGCKFLNE